MLVYSLVAVALIPCAVFGDHNPLWRRPTKQGEDDQWIKNPVNSRNDFWWAPTYLPNGQPRLANETYGPRLAPAVDFRNPVRDGGNMATNTQWWILEPKKDDGRPTEQRYGARYFEDGTPVQRSIVDPQNNNPKWLWVQPPSNPNDKFWWMNVYGRLDTKAGKK